MLKLYKNIVVFTVPVFFFSYLPTYLGLAINPSLAPLIFIYLSIGLVGLLVISDKKSISYIFKNPIYRWMLFYFIILLIWVMLPNAQASVKNIRGAVLPVIFMFITATLVFFDDERLSLTRKAILLATIISIFNNTYEFIKPDAFYPLGDIRNNPGRSAGFYSNANLSGRAIILGLIFSYTIVPNKLKVTFLLSCLLGILFTFSRTGIAAWFIVVFLFSWTKIIKKKQLITLGMVLVTLIILALPFLINMIEAKFEGSSTNLLNRIAFFTSTEQATDSSQNKRLDMALTAFQYFTERPLLGNGIGFFEEWEFDGRPHNVYLLLMVEFGILGVFIYPLLLLSSAWKATGETRRISIVFVSYTLIAGFTTHNSMSSYIYVVAFSIMAGMTFRSKTQYFKQ